MSRDDMEAEVFKFESDRAKRAKRYGKWLLKRTDDPLLKEKVFAILSGVRVDQ